MHSKTPKVMLAHIGKAMNKAVGDPEFKAGWRI
jgi:hypothetical protein